MASIAALAVLTSNAAAEPTRSLTGSAGVPGCSRPYADTSPWNTPIVPNPVIDPNSATHIATIGGNLSSDPTQYTYPVYETSSAVPLSTVTISGAFSNVTGDGQTMENQSRGSVQVPIPPQASAAAGSDAQVVIVNPETGDEWGFWQFRSASGGFAATNGYHYNTRWSGVPPRTASGSPFVSRGAGVTYLAGLIRPCEIERGRIDHALAFAYSYPRSDFVYPATKSDGGSSDPNDVAEGTRLQLDPALTDADLAALGCTGACLTIAHALQVYGMYVIDNSGRAKIMAEFEGTANWGGTITSKTVESLTLDRFRVLDPASSTAAAPPAPPPATEPSPAASEPKKKGKKGKKAKKGKKGKKKGVRPSSGRRLVVAGFRVPGARLEAGRRFKADLRVRPRGRLSTPASVQVQCRASVGKRDLAVIRTELRRKNGSLVAASCEWRVPAWAKARRLQAAVAVAHRGGKAGISFKKKVKAPRR